MRVAVAVLVLVLAGCGKDVCIMGQGDCHVYHHPTPPTRPSLTMTSSVRRVSVTRPATLTVSGGKPAYRWEIVSGAGTLVPGAATQGRDALGRPIWSGTAVYTAPVATGKATIRATDTDGAQAQIELEIVP